MTGHSPVLIVLTSLNFALSASALLICIFLTIVSESIFGITFGPQTFILWSGIIIWSGIYIWQFIWMFYSFANICRRTTDGPVYTNPTLLTPTFFLVSILNWCCIITWSFVWSWGHFWVATFLMAAVFITTYICIGLSYKALAEHKDILIKQGRTREIWMVRLFVQNGLGYYGAWCTIATFDNLATPSFSYQIIKTIMIALSLLPLVSIDWKVMDKFSRYTFSPYIVVVVALVGSIAETSYQAIEDSTVTAILLGVAVFCLVVKIILLFVRHCRDSRSNEMALPILENESCKDTTMTLSTIFPVT